MVMQAEQIGFSVLLSMDFDNALSSVTKALKDEGFGVLTEIDVKETLRRKLDVDFRPYRILGACNPPLAHQALNIIPEVGLLLPCNITLDQVDESLVKVSFLSPVLMLGIIDEPSLKPVAEDANARLRRVAEALEAK